MWFRCFDANKIDFIMSQKPSKLPKAKKTIKFYGNILQSKVKFGVLCSLFTHYFGHGVYLLVNLFMKLNILEHSNEFN